MLQDEFMLLLLIGWLTLILSKGLNSQLFQLVYGQVGVVRCTVGSCAGSCAAAKVFRVGGCRSQTLIGVCMGTSATATTACAQPLQSRPRPNITHLECGCGYGCEFQLGLMIEPYYAMM